MKNVRIRISVLAAIATVFIMLSAIICAGNAAYADNAVTGADGVYSVSVDLSGLAMGANNFSSVSTVEKSGDKYYFTFGHSSSISDLKLVIDGKQAGYTTSTKDGWTYYTYTLSQSAAQSSLPFSAHINAMNSDVSFTVKLDLSSAERTGDYDHDGERPAEFVPTLSLSAGSEYQMQQGSTFPIPNATAVLGTEECEVNATAYYVESGTLQPVTISNGAFKLANVGEYRLIYRATSSSYKTSAGNDTFAEYVVTIVSSVGGSTLAKFEDENGVLPSGTAIMPSRITTGSDVYTTAAEKMKKIADNFEVFGVSFVSSDGGSVTPEQSVSLYFQADATFDRTKTVVYHMDEEGNLTELATSNYGRYVKVETDKTGTFIVCVPGVAFVMPMWGYVLIVVAAVVVVAAAVTVTVILVRKKKKALK